MGGIGRPASGAASAAATGAGDVKLRQLWSEFIRHRAAYRAAWERYQPAYDAFIAELQRCPEDVLPDDHMRAHNWLWRKHGLEELWNGWNSATDAMEAASAAILAVEAEGLLGIGIKLAALPVEFELDSDDLEEARDAVLMDIERLLGVTLEHAASSPIFTLVPVPDPIFAAIEDHQAKFEAVRTLTGHDNLKTEPAPGDPPELVDALAASIAARKTLVSTAPTTLAGVVAVLSYVHDQPGWPSAFLFDKAESRRFIRSLELAARRLAAMQS
jgi:hypothetical protein